MWSLTTLWLIIATLFVFVQFHTHLTHFRILNQMRNYTQESKTKTSLLFYQVFWGSNLGLEIKRGPVSFSMNWFTHTVIGREGRELRSLSHCCTSYSQCGGVNNTRGLWTDWILRKGLALPCAPCGSFTNQKTTPSLLGRGKCRPSQQDHKISSQYCWDGGRWRSVVMRRERLP